MKTSFIHRRAFLGGAGVALSLPWLESLRVWGAERDAAADSSVPPVRYACVYFGNGLGNPDENWWAKGEGEQMQLSRTLAPLEPVKTSILVPQGIVPNGHTGGSHVYIAPTYLSYGRTESATGGQPIVPMSFDQVMAARIGDQTPLPSLAIGVEPVYPGTDKGISKSSLGNISWWSKSTPVPKEIYPALVFDRLVSDGSRQRLNKSVLDLVADDARRLRPRVSRLDQQTLDDYLHSVREIEQRIERDSQQAAKDAELLRSVTMPRPADELPSRLPDHVQLMYDLLLLAFRTNRTRIATLMLNNEISDQDFSFLEGVRGGLHVISHGDAVALQKVNEYQVGEFAKFIAKLQATPEGDGSLLDNCLIQFGCCMWTGNHSAPQVPLVLAGRGGGTLKTGRAVDYSQAAQRSIGHLFLALMDRMGVTEKWFGPYEERLGNLS